MRSKRFLFIASIAVILAFAVAGIAQATTRPVS